MRLVHVVVAAFASLLIAASFLPEIETQWWGVRLLDFPRLQFGICLLAIGIAVMAFGRRAPRATVLLLAGIAAALCAHVVTLWPYRPGGESFLARCEPDRRLSVMVANVLLGNHRAEPLLAMVEREQPDLLLLMETDEWWDRALRPLRASMPFAVQQVTGSFYGLHFFSRLPLIEPEIRHLVDDSTPSVVTGVILRDGERVDFVGVHPRPPQPWQSALGRDAEVYAAALLLRGGKRLGVMAGDLNATPWETAVERTRRVARLIDPRRGYGYVPTFSATSWLESWPLDHVFHEGGFATVSLARLAAFGSDHYPYLVRLCRTQASGDAPPGERPGDLAHARDLIERAGASARPDRVRPAP